MYRICAAQIKLPPCLRMNGSKKYRKPPFPAPGILSFLFIFQQNSYAAAFFAL